MIARIAAIIQKVIMIPLFFLLNPVLVVSLPAADLLLPLFLILRSVLPSDPLDSPPDPPPESPPPIGGSVMVELVMSLHIEGELVNGL